MGDCKWGWTMSTRTVGWGLKSDCELGGQPQLSFGGGGVRLMIGQPADRKEGEGTTNIAIKERGESGHQSPETKVRKGIAEGGKARAKNHAAKGGTRKKEGSYLATQTGQRHRCVKNTSKKGEGNGFGIPEYLREEGIRWTQIHSNTIQPGRKEPSEFDRWKGDQA